MKIFLFALVIFLTMTYLFISIAINRFNPFSWPRELLIIQPLISAASAVFYWLFLRLGERPVRK